MDGLLILQIGTGLFWSLVYLLIIKQWFKDKTTGVPLPALRANIAWEFTLQPYRSGTHTNSSPE